MATVLDLKRAGYADEDIALWVDEKKKKFNEAGYTQSTQSNHLGIPFKSKNSLLNSQMIGPKDPDTYDLRDPDNNNLTEEQKIELEINTNTSTDELTDNQNSKETENFIKYIEEQANLESINPLPYQFNNNLEKEAFANKNKHNSGINEKIYDDRGLPLDETYHSKWTQEENFIHSGSGHTINAIDTFYGGLGLKKNEKKAGAFVLNESLKQWVKVLSGNASYGSRSFAWGDGTFGPFRMSEEQIQTGINIYSDTLTRLNQETPYWIQELSEDKDTSGLPKDASTALFLSYISSQPNFQTDFKKMLSSYGTEDQKTAVRDMLFNNFLIPRKIKSKEFELINNRLVDNLNKHWLNKETTNTTMQIPSFGKGMPDIFSQSGDRILGGEGRRPAYQRGWDQSVTSMAVRLYKDLKELNETGANPMDAKKLIESFMTNGQRWDKRAIAGIASVGSDMGVFGLGALITSPLRSAAASTGGAFGLHEALRWALTESYMRNEIGTFEDFWSIIMSETAAKMYGKGFATGLMVHAGGRVASKTVGAMLTKMPLANTLVGKKILQGTSKITGTAQSGGEVFMLAHAPHIIEWAGEYGLEDYKPPTKEEFLDAAIIVFGLKAGVKGLGYAKNGTITGVKKSSQWLVNGVDKLYQIYAKTGKTPKQLLKEIEIDPSKLEEYQNNDMPIPESIVETQVAKNKVLDNLSGKNEQQQNTVSSPTLTVGNKVSVTSTGLETGEVVSIGFKNGEHIYQVRKENKALDEQILQAKKKNQEIYQKERKKSNEDKKSTSKFYRKIFNEVRKENPDANVKEVNDIVARELALRENKKLEPLLKKIKELEAEKEKGELINIPESSINKTKPPKEVIIWDDTTQFKLKQQSGEYDSKIEVLQKDNQIFETTPHRTSQAIPPSHKEIGTSTDGKAQTNKMMFWINEFYPKLVKEGEKLIEKGKKLEGEMFNLTVEQMVNKIMPKKLNESPIRLLFKVDKNNNLGAERPIIVGDVNNKIFNFDLHSYMALKKLKDGSDAVVTAHTHINESGSTQGVMIFRDAKGNLAGLLMSKASTAKITNEGVKFKNEFGTKGKPFADAQPTSSGSERGFPKWDDLNMSEDVNVFRGLELPDLILMFKSLSGNDVVAKKIRDRIGAGNVIFRTHGQFWPRGKGEIVLNERIFDTKIYLEDGTSRPATKVEYKKKLESILMTMSHELGHYIDYLPDNIIKRGNILNHIKAFKNSINKWTEGKEGGESPLTKNEIAKIRREAEKLAKKEESQTDKELKEEGINPNDILNIIRDAKSREYLPPELYEAFALANSVLKKQILKNAFKGIVDPYMKNVLSGKTKDASNPQKEKANKIFNELFEAEILKRNLVGRDQVMIELKKLTQRWKPFTETKDKKFTKYRYLPEELMADFMMSFLLFPKQTLKAAPIATNLWLNFMHRRPEVQREYDMIHMELALPRNERIANLNRKQILSSMENSAKMIEKANKELQSQGSYDTIRNMMDYHAFTLINYWKKVQGDKHWFSSPTSKKRFEIPLKDNVELTIERYQYSDALIEGIQNNLYKKFWRHLLDSGINRHVFQSYMLNRLIMNPEGSRANVINPKGVERTAAQDMVTHLETKFPKTKDKFSIKELAQKFYEFRQNEIIPLFEKYGMDATNLEIAKNNKEYVTLSVEQYAKFTNDSWALGFVKSTKFGTSKDVMNVVDSTILKDWALINVLQRHQMIGTSVRFLKDYQTQIEGLNRKQIAWNGRFKWKEFKIVKPIEERVYEAAKFDFMTKRWKPVTKGLDVNSSKSEWRLIEWIENGERQAAYIGREIADSINGLQDSKTMQIVHKFAYGMNVPFRKMFTEINPPFWGYNVFRDVWATVQNLEGAQLLDVIHGGKNSFLIRWVQAYMPAWRSIMDPKNTDPIVMDMLANAEILSVFNKYRSRAEGLLEGDPNWTNSTDGIVRSLFLLSKEKKWQSWSKEKIESFFEQVKDKEIKDYTEAEKNFESQLRDGIINNFEQRFIKKNWLGKAKGGFIIGENSWVQPWYKVITSGEMMSRVWERTTKIAAKADMLKRREEGLLDWSDGQIEYAVRNWSGTPNFLRKGTAAALTNNILLYSNVGKENMRRSLEAKRWHKETKIGFGKYKVGVHAGWYGKLFTTTMAPKVLSYAAKAGFMGKAAHMYFNLIGNDTLSTYNVVPLGIINDEGKLEFGMKADEGSVKRAVYLQFPTDEFQKLLGTVAWQSLVSEWGEIKDDVETNTFENIIKDSINIVDDNTPSLAPFLPLAWNAIKATGWFSKDPPKDYFTGKDLYPEYLQRAEGTTALKMRAEAFAKYAWNNSGGLMLYKFDTYYELGNQKKIITELEEKLNIPMFGKLVGRFLKVSDRGMDEKVWSAVMEKRTDVSTAKAVLDNAMERVIGADGKIDFDKLTPEENNAMLLDPSWISRYHNAAIKTFGSQRIRILSGLEGRDLVEAIQAMTKIEYDFGYEYE